MGGDVMLLVPDTILFFPMAALIDLDVSVLIQWGIFLFTTICLNYLVFRPMLRVEELRESRTSGAREEADQQNAEADRRIAQYEESIRDARRAGSDSSLALREEAVSASNEMESEARARANKAIDDALPGLHETYETSRATLQKAASEMSESILDKILGAPSAGGKA
jgi:F0F1-type ATP synthase membrane subunit b/b'